MLGGIEMSPCHLLFRQLPASTLGLWTKARGGREGTEMPSGDVMRVTLEGTFDGEPVVIGLGFVSNSGAATWEEDAGNLINEVMSTLGLDGPLGSYTVPLSSHYTLDRIRAQDLNPGLGASQTVEIGQAGQNDTDDALPPNDALCVTWRTGLKGKQNRGRSYLTGFAEDSQTAGYWIPEIQSWAGTFFAGVLLNEFGPLGPGNYALSVIHTMSGGVRLDPPTATPITSYTVNNTVRSLRRRAVGVRVSRRPSTP